MRVVDHDLLHVAPNRRRGVHHLVHRTATQPRPLAPRCGGGRAAERTLANHLQLVEDGGLASVVQAHNDNFVL